MKVAPLHRALVARSIPHRLVHTGQHFDHEMSADLADILALPKPAFELGVGPGSGLSQLAEMLAALEQVVLAADPDLVVVVGDVTSTLAGALTADRVGIPVAHVEAGLRSGDWRMPEERNRVIVDRISDHLFTPSADADENLRHEGVPEGRIHRVGNVMIDSLDWILERAPVEEILASHGVRAGGYGLVTVHRQANVDDPEILRGLLAALGRVAAGLRLLLPLHPRTRLRMEQFRLEAPPGLDVLPPLRYDHFIALLSRSVIVLTDSGGIQEEAIVLGIPCLTLRENTERPITVEMGGNQVVGTDPDAIVTAVDSTLRDRQRYVPRRPELWDGHAADRIGAVIEAALVRGDG